MNGVITSQKANLHKVIKIRSTYRWRTKRGAHASQFEFDESQVGYRRNLVWFSLVQRAVNSTPRFNKQGL